jgi:protein-tyrosine phosphatase
MSNGLSVDSIHSIFFTRGSQQRSRFNNLGPQGLTSSRITEHLHIGGELGPDDWKALTSEGISVVINMQRERQDHFRDDQAVDAYLWLPVSDGWAPSMQQLKMGVAFARDAIAAEKSVFVHCKAGQGRGPLLCACYLLEQGLSTEDALAHLNAARPRTQFTLEQQIRLHEYAAMVQGERERIRQEAEAEARAAEARTAEAQARAAEAETLATQAEARAAEALALAAAAEARMAEALAAEAGVAEAVATQALVAQAAAAQGTTGQAGSKRSVQPPAHSLTKEIFEFATSLHWAFRTPNLRVVTKKPRVQAKRTLSSDTSPKMPEDLSQSE